MIDILFFGIILGTSIGYLIFWHYRDYKIIKKSKKGKNG
jgi:hypothetical protein